MSTPDPIRALLAEMADELDHNRQCLLDDRSLTHPLADRARAVLARWGRPAAPPADLPPDYIDEWITNPRDRALLEVFHKACNAEGGSADEVILRGLKAVLQDGLSRSHRLQQENHRFREPERTILCDILANGTLLPDPDGTRYGIPPAPLEGEVGELVAALRSASDGASAMGWERDSWVIARAATLLEQLSAAVPAVVPMAALGEVLPQGTWWLFVPGNETDCPAWTFIEIEYARAAADAPFPITHLLPAHAIPLPAPQGGEVG